MIRKKIAAIGPGGHTLIYPAVEQAYFALRTAKARAKHVVLLSDGRSYPDDYEGLVTKMVNVLNECRGPAILLCLGGCTPHFACFGNCIERERFAQDFNKRPIA